MTFQPFLLLLFFVIPNCPFASGNFENRYGFHLIPRSESLRPVLIIEGPSEFEWPVVKDLNLINAMGLLNLDVRSSQRRKRRSPPHVLVLDSKNNGSDSHGRCILSADQAVHFCGFAEEVNVPPIPPPFNGICVKSGQSGREICYPRYDELDTTCTDTSSEGLHAPPAIPHATVHTMAFVPPDNLHRLIRQWYREHGKPYPKNESELIEAKSFLFVKYLCEPGYDMIDEIDTMFCQNRQWVHTHPVCRGKGLCEHNNGGCSHSCSSFDDTIQCRCPKGLVLDSDERTCIRPVPKNLCRKLSGCSCGSVDDSQFICTCPPYGEKCLLLKGIPKIYLDPFPPYEVEPGGTLNISCAAVAYPFPSIHWVRDDKDDSASAVEMTQSVSRNGAIKSEEILIIKEIYKDAEYTCYANNEIGETKRSVGIIVAGPGSAPVIREIDAGRTKLNVNFEAPHLISRPITNHTVYYTTNPTAPIGNWLHTDVPEPQHRAEIIGLQPDTVYTIRIRANDLLGKGKLSNPVSVRTQKPATMASVHILEGDELRVPPLTQFIIHCNSTGGDPLPAIYWETHGRRISEMLKNRQSSLQHDGLYETSEFVCAAENEAGTARRPIKVIVTGPSPPERIRYNVDGNKINVAWETPRIINAPIRDYEIIYADKDLAATLPEDQWPSIRVGSPDMTTITIPDLKELTDYTVKVKGHNIDGVGIPSVPFTVRTWLAPRSPTAYLDPSGTIERKPSLGEELSIFCQAHGVPKPKIVWFWNDAPVEDDNDGFRIYDVTPLDSPQNITQFRLVDSTTTRSGVAKCHAINENGADEASVEVRILGPGSPPEEIRPETLQDGFQVNWKEPNVPNGKITNYVLYYSTDPDKDLDEWEKEQFPGDIHEATISNREEDTPHYIRLQATNEDGPGIISPAYEVTTGKKHIELTVKLQILEPVVSEGDEATLVEPGSPIRFKCITDGRPKPSVFYTWVSVPGAPQGSDEPVHMAIEPHDEDKQPHHFQTAIFESQTKTRRTLVCNAQNIHGTVEDRHTFDVLKPGSEPTNIEPIVDVDNTVTITWDPPTYPNGDISKYTLYLSSDPTLPHEQWRPFVIDAPTEPGAKPKIVFARGELEPKTPYYIRLSASNDHGEGATSTVVHFLTESGAPLDAPTDVLVNIAMDNTVDITWGPPLQPNGILKHYTVYFTPDDPEVRDEANFKRWTRIETPVLANGTGRITLDKSVYNILPEHDYRVRITATNDQSEGPATGVVSFTTGTGEIPPQITLSPVDNPAMVLPGNDYHVRCEATGIPAPDVFWSMGVDNEPIQGGSISLHLRSLIKDTTVTCHAKNNAGKAQEVLEILVQGPGTPPNEIVALAQPDQMLNIEWAPPDEPNGALTGYIVHYGEVPEGEREPTEWHKIHVPAGEVRHKLAELKPKTVYAVRIQAVSDRGEGLESDPQYVRTLPLAPKPPETTEVTVHDNNTIVVSFPPSVDPVSPKDPIKQYKLMYTTDPDPTLPDAKWEELEWNVPPEQLQREIFEARITGDMFDPKTKYTVKVIPVGEVEGVSSVPIAFETTTGIIAPDAPLVNVQMEDGNIIRVPAGTDYAVLCSPNIGYPIPEIRWLNKATGEILSDGPHLKVSDLKTTIETVCIAENIGGKAETPFTIYVSGPGDAPDNIQLKILRPKSIDVYWDPPIIPNGNIVRYIIYYTPLEDQRPEFMIGQVPSKPYPEWMTYHVIGGNLNKGRKHATISDFIEPNTAYAIVIQAANEDAPGPYSIMHSIRTMSSARADPPKHLRVEPINSTSVEVLWEAAGAEGDEKPVSYELYYIPADKKIWEDEFASLAKWSAVKDLDPSQLTHMLAHVLAPDTEYVFKVRAIYPSGPGIFSEPCIARTLPDGDVPFIVVSTGDRGKTGTSKVLLLPGSSYKVWCRAAGRPDPSVKWQRGGNIPIDPSTVEVDKTETKWSLSLANISDDSTFNCLARNPLGIANFTIKLEIVDGLQPGWQSNIARAELRDGRIYIRFDDHLPESLRKPDTWRVIYTDDTTKPQSSWDVLELKGTHLDEIVMPEDVKKGVPYQLIVKNVIEDIQSPVLNILNPKPPSEVQIGSNINDEIVVDFRPAISLLPVQHYTIRYWPVTKQNDKAELEPLKTIEVPGDKTSGIVIPDLLRDTEYNFQVVASLPDNKQLASEPVHIRTPAEEVRCDCSHACRLVESETVKWNVECYCPSGYELAEDTKTCKQIEPSGRATFQVTAPFDIEQHPPSEQKVMETTHPTKFLASSTLPPRVSPYPTDEAGRPITGVSVGLTEGVQVLPTDELGREIYPIIFFNGTRLPTDEQYNVYDPFGSPIEFDDEQRPIGPDGRALQRNAAGFYIYPPIDKHGQPMPTDSNFRPIHAVVDEDGNEFKRDQEGKSVDEFGRPLPTDAYGQPVGPDASPFPTDYFGRFIAMSTGRGTGAPGATPVPTDIMGYPVYPVIRLDGSPLPTASSGRYINDEGEEVEQNDAGIPLGSDGKPMSKNARGEYVYMPVSRGGADQLLPEITDLTEGSSVDQILPAESREVVEHTTAMPMPKTITPTPSIIVVGPDGHPLSKDETGHFVSLNGEPISLDSLGRPVDARGDVLPRNELGQYIYPEQGELVEVFTPSLQPVVVLGPGGSPLPTESKSGVFLGPGGMTIPTNAEGLPIGPDASPLPTNEVGHYIALFSQEHDDSAKVLPTDDFGRAIYPVVDEYGFPLPTDEESGRYVGANGEIIPVDEFGRPLDEKGIVFPVNSENEYVYKPPMTTTTMPPPTTLPTLFIEPEELPSREESTIAPVIPSEFTSKELSGEVAVPKDTHRARLSDADLCQFDHAAIDLIVAINNELLEKSIINIRRIISDLFARHMDFAADVARVGIIHYGQNVIVPIPLGGYHDRNEVLEKLEHVVYNPALGVPNIGSVYRSAHQQFREFSRPNVAKYLLIFLTGDDLQANSERHLIDQLGVEPVLVGPSSYESEIQTESQNHVTVDEWSTLDAPKLVKFFETQCIEGAFKLPQIRSVFVAAPAGLTPDVDGLGQRAQEIATKTGSVSSERCQKLRQRSKIILLVETSPRTAAKRSQLKASLLHFIREHVESSHPLVGLIAYSSIVDVKIDVGNYVGIEDLEEAVEKLENFPGGTVDPILAIRTASQLFRDRSSEQSSKLTKIILHVFFEPIETDRYAEMEAIAQRENIALLDFDYDKWSMLENREPYWSNQLCMVESLIERLQGAIPPNLNEIFFGSSSTPPSRNVRRKIRWSRLPPKRGINPF